MPAISTRVQAARAVLSAVLFLGLAACPARAGKTIHVRAGAAGGGDGTSWASAYADLDAALASAISGDEIWIAEGTYTPAQSYGFLVDDAVGLYGGFAGTETDREAADPSAHYTILDGTLSSGMAYNALQLSGSGSCTLYGLTFQGAQCGLYVSGGVTLLIDRCRMINNGQPGDGTSYESGAGLRISGGTAITIDRCLISGNSASGEAGLYVNGCADAVVRRSVVAYNTAYFTAGAIGAADTVLTVENCLFYGNRSTVGPGPGVYVTNESTVQVINCTFLENTGPHGNAVCAFTPATATVTNCVIADNSSGSREHFYTDASAHLTVAYCLLPASLDQIETIHHPGYGQVPTDGGGNVIGAPVFVNAASPLGPDGIPATADDGLILAAGSPGIDQGTATGAARTDLLGNTRLAGAGVDTGCYETGAAAAADPDFSLNLSTTFDSYSEGRRHAVRLAVEGSHSAPVDVYVAIFLPDGSYYCCSDWRVFAPMNQPVPMLRSWTVEETDENAMVLSLPAAPTGRYRWVAVVLETGKEVLVESNWLATSEAAWTYTNEE